MEKPIEDLAINLFHEVPKSSLSLAGKTTDPVGFLSVPPSFAKLAQAQQTVHDRSGSSEGDF